MRSSEGGERGARRALHHLRDGLGILAALVVVFVVSDPWQGLVGVVVIATAAGWVVHLRREAAWSEEGWRQLELLSPELVGQLDESAILRVALADSSTLLRAEVTQVRLHGRTGSGAVVATQREQDTGGVEIKELDADEEALVPDDGALTLALPGPGREIGRLTVRGGAVRHRRTRRRLAQGLAHLIASSVAAERVYAGQRTLAEDLYRSALRDDLTGLGNRALLHERGSQVVARSMAHQKCTALLLLDLDDFKRINDTLGHSAGDRVLAEVATRIRSQIRDTDLAVRLGGDEFVVLAGELAAPADAELLAGRLLSSLAVPVPVDGIELQLSSSLGIAVHGEDADSLESLIAVADQAMYQAKGAGRAGWRRRTRPPGALETALDLGRGLPADQIELHYQPQRAATGERVLGFEVLTQWRHPELGLLAPEDFLPELERRGLTGQLAAAVLDRALPDLVALRAGAPGAVLSMDVSPRDLLRRDLITIVTDALAAHGAVGADLVLGMPEPAPELSTMLEAVLTGLEDLGCAVSIHGFGTGRSSLAALASHPVIAEVKLSPRMVATVLTDDRAMRVVRASVDCAHGLGLRVVAEGVETTEIALVLAELGCDRLQGIGIGEPLPVQAVAPGAPGARPAPTAGPRESLTA